jgi:hypothetical protein
MRPPHHLQGDVHRAVVFQDPTHLARHVALAQAGLPDMLVQQVPDADRMILG